MELFHCKEFTCLPAQLPVSLLYRILSDNFSGTVYDSELTNIYLSHFVDTSTVKNLIYCRIYLVLKI